ncbi:MAG: DUF4465 domain-containing protein [Muribaculaceae bacterium]|nr:DUF4465 domain-containing protein [Muribaculaceae bacterium]
MKKLLRFAACGFALVAAATFTGCSNEDALVDNFDAADGKPLTRSASSQVVIDFEDLVPFEDVDVLAGPTSYGRNYYSDYSGTQITGIMDLDGYFMSMVNKGVWPAGTAERTSFEFGGIAVSDWAMISNPSSNPNPDKPFKTDWWYSEYNQMSVYNTARTATGNRGGAGANGSNNFGVVFGYDDSYGYIKEASFTNIYGSMTLKSLKICNTAYTYGVIQNGNKWYENGVESGTAVSLVETKGYLNLIIKCYDDSGNLVKRIETPLADYRNGKNLCLTTWTTIPVNAANVAKVQFGFWGSDVGKDGLNTPAYVAIDDIIWE